MQFSLVEFFLLRTEPICPKA